MKLKEFILYMIEEIILFLSLILSLTMVWLWASSSGNNGLVIFYVNQLGERTAELTMISLIAIGVLWLFIRSVLEHNKAFKCRPDKR